MVQTVHLKIVTNALWNLKFWKNNLLSCCNRTRKLIINFVSQTDRKLSPYERFNFIPKFKMLLICVGLQMLNNYWHQIKACTQYHIHAKFERDRSIYCLSMNFWIQITDFYGLAVYPKMRLFTVWTFTSNYVFLRFGHTRTRMYNNILPLRSSAGKHKLIITTLFVG